MKSVYERALAVVGGDVETGESLRSWQAGQSRGERLRMYLKLADALVAMHELGLAFGDLSPDKVAVVDGVPVLVDVHLRAADDVARLKRAYLAPECGDGERSFAADQYAFAVCLWEALTGARPGANAVASDGITKLLLRAMDEVPAKRFASLRDLQTALRVSYARTRDVTWVACIVAAFLCAVAWAWSGLALTDESLTGAGEAVQREPARAPAVSAIVDVDAEDAFSWDAGSPVDSLASNFGYPTQAHVDRDE